jgi:hypothetical protein
MIHLLIYYDRLVIVASVSPHQCEGSPIIKEKVMDVSAASGVPSRAVYFTLRDLGAFKAELKVSALSIRLLV